MLFFSTSVSSTSVKGEAASALTVGSDKQHLRSRTIHVGSVRTDHTLMALCVIDRLDDVPSLQPPHPHISQRTHARITLLNHMVAPRTPHRGRRRHNRTEVCHELNLCKRSCHLCADLSQIAIVIRLMIVTYVYTRVYPGIPGYTRVYPGIPRYISGYTREFVHNFRILVK